MKTLKVVLFISRNKDNKNLPDFKERRFSFLSDKSDDELQQEFDEFIHRGMSGEKSRLYRSVNNRDNEKIRKALIHYLVDHEEQDMSKLDRRIASIASLKENASEKKWLFDFDEHGSYLSEFLDDLVSYISIDTGYTTYETPNGNAVVVERGFDTRELLEKWENVELKRDDMLCINWGTKEPGTMKLYRTRTQAEYDWLMWKLEDEGYTWLSGGKPTEKDYWRDFKDATVIKAYNHDKELVRPTLSAAKEHEITEVSDLMKPDTLEQVVAEKNNVELTDDLMEEFVINDPIEPEHYNKGEIDLYESWYRTYPFNEFRAGMQMIAERYMRRDKDNRVEDLDKGIYTLERLKEYEEMEK